MNIEIHEGAIFVADAHFNQKNREFLIFLKQLIDKKIVTNQLFLMGDIIDFISCECRYFIERNLEIIEILNKLSEGIEIIYLEGNHDFNLKSLFPNIKVIKKDNQPFFVKMKNKTVCLSHGDNFINWKYELFCKIIRNSIFLRFMNFIDFDFFISKKLEKALLEKNICHKIEKFEELVYKRLENYSCDIVIEGHYHQGGTYMFGTKKYINIPSLCCQKKYMVFKDSKIEEETLCIC